MRANCTSKAFRKKYGVRPFANIPESVPESVERMDYTRDQLVSITKTLEGQISEYENRGMGEGAECVELRGELVEMYYQLAEAEPNETVAENIREEARVLEDGVYGIGV